MKAVKYQTNQWKIEYSNPKSEETSGRMLNSSPLEIGTWNENDGCWHILSLDQEAVDLIKRAFKEVDDKIVTNND